MARTTKTPPLESLDDLSRLLDDLWQQVEEAGRERSEIDIHFVCAAGGSPAQPNFDAAAHRGGLDQLAQLGVTWVGVATTGKSVDAAIEALERYGDRIISHERR